MQKALDQMNLQLHHVISDITGMTGNRFRAHPLCASVPVIIVTSSDAPRDRKRAELLGASFYFRKPSDLLEFMELGRVIKEAVREPATSQLSTSGLLGR